MGELLNRNKKNYEFKNDEIQSYPRNMLIELTNNCNHQCIFCENRKMTRKKGFIDEFLLKRILQEAYRLGTREVGYYATGEPLMCKLLSKYIRMAKDIGFEYVYITTNGALLEKELMEKIVEAGIDSIKFSINAGTKDTYKKIHGFDDFEKVIANLKRLAKYRKDQNKNFKIYVSFIRTRNNENEYELLKEIVSSFVDDIECFNVYNQGGNMYEINEILTLERNHKAISVPCSMVFNRFHITFEGYLNICCVDFQNYLAVADLKVLSLKEAWNCEKFKEVRRKHLENKLEGIVCYNCINNANESVKPLVKEYATIYENDVNKEIEYIKNRIE